MNVWKSPAVLMASLLAASCGGGASSPVTPSVPASTLAPAAAAAPEVAPTPEPSPTPAPVAPVGADGAYANGQTPVVRFTVKVYWVQDKEGHTRTWEPGDKIRVGESLRFDSQGKDQFNQPTEGWDREPRWSWFPDEVAMLSGDAGFNPRAKALKPGLFWVAASLDGVDSNELELEIIP